MADDLTLAVHHFGLGARPGERAEVGGDPRSWLLQQVDPKTPDPAFARWAALPSHMALWAEALATREKDPDPQHKGTQVHMARMIQREAAERCALGVITTRPFAERWARFWCRHFAVSAQKSRIESLVGPYEREAIRPRVFGRFSALLDAAVTHPAMLIYLDNDRSVGPGSDAGRRRESGLNENLAREVLELHTLGVDGGYTQADVEALAAILTGWGVVRPSPARLERNGGTVPATGTRFARRRHEPGDKVLLGTTHREGGADELTQALRQLARHPSTARHLAHKLAVHFVADRPDPAVVEIIAATFLETEGDLAAVARLLVTNDAIWAAARWTESRKLRPPIGLLVATGRALGLGDPPRAPLLLTGARPKDDWALTLSNRSRALGQRDFCPPSPAGWPDTSEAWAGPDQLLRRVELARWASRFARRRAEGVEGWAEDVLGPLSPSLAEALEEASDRRTAAGLVLASPALQWRST